MNYHFWHTGPVINQVGELTEVLQNCECEKQKYLSVQRQLFKENFLADPREKAIEKGAKAIDHFMKTQSDS